LLISLSNRNSHGIGDMLVISQHGFKLFLSSPSGLDPEREIVLAEAEALSDLELTKGNPKISVIAWPNTIAAGAGPYGQSVINRQTIDHDILVCVVGIRMGTATPQANSGTEEEFNRAYLANLDGKDVQILLFFSDLAVRPSSIDPYQLMLVRAFREKAGRLGILYHSFRDHDEFRQLLQTSLADAYGQLTRGKNKKANRQSILPMRTISKTIDYPDLHFAYQATAPQAADVHLFPIAGYRRCDIKVIGVVVPCSRYLRFGFKYFEAREPLFSAGSIQTIGQNILVHIGRNKDNPSWFVTQYRSGTRVGPDRLLPMTENKSEAHFEIEISAVGAIAFVLDSEVVYKGYLPIDGLPGLALLAWGDENDFSCDVKNLKLTINLNQ
jgi:hypothetical protein